MTGRVNGLAHRADADDRRRLDATRCRRRSPGSARAGARTGFWKSNRSLRLGSSRPLTSNIEIRACASFEGQALLHHGGGDQAGEADGGGTGAEEEDALVADLAAGDLEGGDQSGERHAARALDVVVVAAHLVAVARQQVDRVAARPVLEVDAAVREHLLHRLHELVHEGVQLLGRRARPPQPEVERIVEVLSGCWCRRRGTSAAGPAAARRRRPCRAAACRWGCPCRWRPGRPGRGCGRRRSRR